MRGSKMFQTQFDIWCPKHKRTKGIYLHYNVILALAMARNEPRSMGEYPNDHA